MKPEALNVCLLYFVVRVCKLLHWHIRKYVLKHDMKYVIKAYAVLHLTAQRTNHSVYVFMVVRRIIMIYSELLF